MQTRLKHALQSLAMVAEIQLSLFPEFVLKAEELALTFEHWYLCLRNNDEDKLSEDQKLSLAAIDEYLNQMSGEGKAHLWTEEATESEPEWEKLRELARQALKSFDWELGVPPKYWDEYISIH